MAIKRYNEFVNENSILDEEFRRNQTSQLDRADQRLLARAKFKKGDKVIWSEGGAPWYTIDYPFVDMGVILYNLRSPEGISSGGRVREDELRAFDEELDNL